MLETQIPIDLPIDYNLVNNIELPLTNHLFEEIFDTEIFIDPLKFISIKCSVCNPLASLLNRNILRISIIFSKKIYNDSVLGG